jgi:hypothetical protein
MAEILKEHGGDEMDLPLWGARAIGSVINRSECVTFDLLEKGELPAQKVGGRWVSTKRRLLGRLNGAVT